MFSGNLQPRMTPMQRPVGMAAPQSIPAAPMQQRPIAMAPPQQPMMAPARAQMYAQALRGAMR